MKYYVTVLCLTAALAWANPPQTQGERVIVTASRLSVPLGMVCAKVSIISSEEIAASNAESLSELLAQKLPLYVKQSPGMTGTVWMGGMKSDDAAPSSFGRVLILLNGHPAGSGNLDRIPFNAVTRVEVLEGPSSAMYGSGALAGVINIITRKKSPQDQIQAGVKGGSFGLLGAELAADFHVSDSFYGVLDFSSLSQGDYQTASGQAYKNTGYGKTQAYGGFFVPLAAGLLEGSVSYLRSREVGNPNALVINDLDDYSEGDHINVDVHYEKYWSSFSLQGSGYFVSDRHLNVGKGSGPFDNWEFLQRLYETGFSVMGRQNWGRARFLMGLSADYARLGKQSETGSYNEPKTEYLLGGVFAEGQWEALKGLVFNLGLRYDRYQMSVMDSTGITFSGNEKSKDFDFFALRGGASWQEGSWLAKISAGTGFTAPTMLQLAGNYTGSWGDYEGNPDLEPEKSWALQASGGYSGRHSLLFSYQYQEIRDRITTTPWTFGVPTSYLNQKAAILENVGMEGRLNWENFPGRDWIGTFRINGIYYLRAQDEESREELVYVPEVKMTAGISLALHGLGALSVDGVYTGRFLDGVTRQALGKTYSLDTGLYLTPFDYWLPGSLWAGLRLEAALKNVTNEKLIFVDGYPLPGRHFQAGISYRYVF